MTPNSIKAVLTLRNMSQREAAARVRERGVPCSAEELNQTIHGDRENPDIQEAFAQVLGIPKSEVFDAEFYAIVALRQSA